MSGSAVTTPCEDLTTTTDENGNYFFVDVPEGNQNIMMTHPDYETQEDSIDFSEGETAETDQIPMEDKEGDDNMLSILQ
ncbi:MAG: carboxypeptidase regulatory-like domain-containing protein [Thermoplasmatota archaeon]